MPPDSPYAVLVVVPQGIRGARQLQGKDDLAEFSRHQLSREYLAQRQADCEVRRCRRSLAHLRVQRHRRRASLERRTCWRCRYSRPQRPTWPSPLWTGIPRLPTRTWDCGGMSTWRPAGRWRCAIQPWFRMWMRRPTIARSSRSPRCSRTAANQPVKGTLKGQDREDRILAGCGTGAEREQRRDLRARASFPN